MHDKPNTVFATSGCLDVYLAYLLRYVRYPISAPALQKLAKDKHYKRLAVYFAELPADSMFESADDAVAELRLLSH